LSFTWPGKVKARRKLLPGFYINGTMREMKEQDQPKNAVPISLYPLKPKDAIRGLMMVKPPPKQAKKLAKKTARKK